MLVVADRRADGQRGRRGAAQLDTTEAGCVLVMALPGIERGRAHTTQRAGGPRLRLTFGHLPDTRAGEARYARGASPHVWDVVKYWGDSAAGGPKRVPIHGVVGVATDDDALCCTGEGACSLSIVEDALVIDGVPCAPLPRGYADVLDELKRHAAGNLADTHVVVAVRTCARNGLASVGDSGSAVASCFVAIAANLLQSEEAYDGHHSVLARTIGGLAACAMAGGFAKWTTSSLSNASTGDEIQPAGSDLAMARESKGADAASPDSVAACICEPDSPFAGDIRTLTVVVSPEASQLRTLAGGADASAAHQAALDRFASAATRSVATSSLLSHRAEKVVPARLHAVESCVARGDFEGLARLTSAESNQIAAVCADTSPPLYFMSDVTRRVVAIVERYNHHVGRTVAAYTCAPLSAAITVIVKGAADEAAMLARLLHAFPATGSRPLVAARSMDPVKEAEEAPSKLPFVRGRGAGDKLRDLGVSGTGDLVKLSAPPESPNAVVWPDSTYALVLGGVGGGATAEDIGEADATEAAVRAVAEAGADM